MTFFAHVYHGLPDAEGRSFHVGRPFTPENYRLVAVLDFTAEWKHFEADSHWLEVAFEMTNSIGQSWHEKTPSLVGPTRSTSVGDIVVLLREGAVGVWQVDRTGWTPLATQETPPARETSKTLYQVLWDNGHACGALLSTFETEEDAEAYGRDWQTEMVAATPGATDDDYSYEVVEVRPDEATTTT